MVDVVLSASFLNISVRIYHGEDQDMKKKHNV